MDSSERQRSSNMPSGLPVFRGTRRPEDRSAMTLFELLLVLVLLVVAGTLAAPLLDGSFSSIRLRRGTDQMLAAWSEARAHAIDSGLIYQFRFKPQEGIYRIEPWVPELNQQMLRASSQGAGPGTQFGSNDTSELVAETSEWSDEATLPEQVVFHAGNLATEDRQVGRSVVTLREDSRSEWSRPILFFPDGSTSSASVVLKNDRDVYQRATLRALTGVGRSSGSLTADEVERLQFR